MDCLSRGVGSRGQRPARAGSPGGRLRFPSAPS